MVKEQAPGRRATKKRPSGREAAKQPRSGRKTALTVAIVSVAVIAVVLGVRAYWNTMLPPEPPRLTGAQYQAVTSALAQKGYPAPAKIEISDKKELIATFMVPEPKSPAYIKGYGTESLIAIRDALQPKSPAKSYRVNINGEGPQPDMNIKWGHATYAGGDSVEWEAGH